MSYKIYGVLCNGEMIELFINEVSVKRYIYSEIIKKIKNIAETFLDGNLVNVNIDMNDYKVEYSFKTIAPAETKEVESEDIIASKTFKYEIVEFESK